MNQDFWESLERYTKLFSPPIEDTKVAGALLDAVKRLYRPHRLDIAGITRDVARMP